MAVTLADAPVIDRITLGAVTLATAVTIPENAYGEVVIQPIAGAVRLAYVGADTDAITDNYLTLYAGEKFTLSANLGVNPRTIYIGGDAAGSIVVEIMVEQNHAQGAGL